MASIAVDLGGTRIKVGIVENGQIVATTKVKSESGGGIGYNLMRVSGDIRKLLRTNMIPESSLSGIGLSFPGVVDTQNSRVLSKYVKFHDAHLFDFERWAKEEWGLPTMALANDAKAALVGEWKYGAGKGHKNLVLLTLGTGVGSGVLLEGNLLNGSHYLAGNLAGHMSINLDGEGCNCGFYGCVETEASTWAIPHKIKNHRLFEVSTLQGSEEIGIKDLFEGAENGDRLSKELLEQFIKVWGLCVVNMVHAYDPEKIIIGGGIMNRKSEILPALQQMIDKYAWLDPGTVKVVPAEQVEFAGLLGMDFLLQNRGKV